MDSDIRERKRAQQAREDIEEQWKAAFESNPTMYFIVDVSLKKRPVLVVVCEDITERMRA